MTSSVSNSYTKYNSWTRHLAADEIIVFIKSRVIFKQYIPKKHKQFGINLYKLCGSKGYTYNMTMCLGKDRKHVTPSIATHVTVILQGLNMWDTSCTFHLQHYLMINILRQ